MQVPRAGHRQREAGLSLVTFGTPGWKSHADAARWVVHRRMEGASREQIIRELQQDGIPPEQAEAVYEEIRRELYHQGMPHGWRLVILTAVLFVVAVLEGWLWRLAAPHSPRPEEYLAWLMSDVFIAVACGVVTAIVVAVGSGGRRSVRLIALAVGVDAVGLGWSSRLVEAHGPSTGLTKTGIIVASIVSVWCLNRWKPWYELVVGDDGQLRWERL
jgi:hypothetical protein